METPGDLIKQARTGSGMSRPTLSRETGIPVGTIKRIESGATDPENSTKAAALMKFFGIGRYARPEVGDAVPIHRMTRAQLVDRHTELLLELGQIATALAGARPPAAPLRQDDEFEAGLEPHPSTYASDGTPRFDPPGQPTTG